MPNEKPELINMTSDMIVDGGNEQPSLSIMNTKYEMTGVNFEMANCNE